MIEAALTCVSKIHKNQQMMFFGLTNLESRCLTIMHCVIVLPGLFFSFHSCRMITRPLFAYLYYGITQLYTVKAHLPSKAYILQEQANLSYMVLQHIYKCMTERHAS